MPKNTNKTVEVRSLLVDINGKNLWNPVFRLERPSSFGSSKNQ